jgi:hypothetical protein
MGTRARIGIQLQHNTVLSAYHHWDGYPEWLGVTLKEQYNSREKAADLINGGNMSTCWADEVWGKKLPEGEFAPEYYTGRGEKLEDNAPRFDDSIFDYLSKENNEEYAYIWTVNNEWKCFKMNQFNDAAPEKVAIPAS